MEGATPCRFNRFHPCPPPFALFACSRFSPPRLRPSPSATRPASRSPSSPQHGTPAVSIVQPADYLRAIVSVRSTAKDPERQAIAVQETVRRLTTAIQRSNTLQLHQGPARMFGGCNQFRRALRQTQLHARLVPDRVRRAQPSHPRCRRLRGHPPGQPSHRAHRGAQRRRGPRRSPRTLAVAAAADSATASCNSSASRSPKTREQLGANVLARHRARRPRARSRHLDHLTVEL